MMGCVRSKEKVLVKNILPKDHEISSASGEIILKKDEDFDMLCLDINFYGFLSTRVHLWPVNSPTAPPLSTPDSSDSGYDCQ